jgi:hypothetical protein
MTKWVGLIVIFLCSLDVTGQAQKMYVKEKTGTNAIFTLNAIRKIIFPGGNMTVINLDGNSETFDLTDIRYVNFTDLSTGIYPLEIQIPESLILFPNPVSDILTINYLSLGTEIQYEVLTLEGNTILRKKITIQSGINQVNINVSSLPEGMYLCRFINRKAVLTNKFLKQ